MSRRMILLTARTAVLAWGVVAFGKETEISVGKPIQAGQSWLSPGGAYLATFTGAGFEIKTRATGQVAKVESLPPVFHAAWTQDEKTLATIEHLAGGTDAVCFHFDAAKETWRRFEVEPPGGPFDRYQVTKWDVGETRVRVTYKALSRHGNIFTTYAVGLEVDPERDVITHVATTKLSEEVER